MDPTAGGAAKTESHRQQVGHGRFELRDRLGSGGAAVVHAAYDTVLDVPRAVKLLRFDHEVIRERFLAEARVLARMRHPNLVRVVDYGEDEHSPWMAMELATGGTLADRLGSGPLSPADTIAVANELLCGLGALHDRGFVHRDVKPSNVLFGDDDEVWLADLGVVLGKGQLTDRQYSTSGALGTAGYQAPELRKDPTQVDHTVDLYSVGALMVAALTARPPPDLSLIDLAPHLLARLPEPIVQVIKGATRFAAVDRYPTAEAMVAALAEIRHLYDPNAPSVPSAMALFHRNRARAGGSGTVSLAPTRTEPPVVRVVTDVAEPPMQPQVKRFVIGALIALALFAMVLVLSLV